MIWLVCLSLLCINAEATLEKSYQEGAEYMAEHAPTKETVIGSNKHDVPGFVTDSPVEAAIYTEPNAIEDKSRQAAQSNDAAQNLSEIANTRQRFKIDEAHDPLFKLSPAENDLDVADLNSGVQSDDLIEKTCLEGGEDITYECLENRIVTLNVPLKTATLTVNHLQFTPIYRQEQYVVRRGNFWRHTQYGTRNVFSHYALRLPKDLGAFKEIFCKGFTGVDCQTKAAFNIDCNRIIGFKLNGGGFTEDPTGFNIANGGATLNITLEHKTYANEEVDSWTGCDHFEQLVEDGLCQYGERTLTQGSQTRNINGYPITKEDWQYRQTYNCKMIKDECNALKAAGCVQIDSKCKEYRANKCWIYEQKYSCPNGKLSISKVPNNSGIFCLTGNCHDASFDANRDMLDVIAKLTVLKEVQDDVRAQNHSDNLQIFKGKERKCARNCLSFKDCCGGMKGWGVSLKLAGCKAEEQELAQMRQKNLCHQVGTYCSKKILGKCVSKKTSFCCFSSRFAKVLHEQGRGQLGLNWGTAKVPNCCPLTVAQLARLDLSKIDFSELFQDIMQKYKSPNLSELQGKTQEQITENMQAIAGGLKIKKGVVDEKKDSL